MQKLTYITGESQRHITFNKTLACPNEFSRDNPQVERTRCEINDTNFHTLFEDGDMYVKVYENSLDCFYF